MNITQWLFELSLSWLFIDFSSTMAMPSDCCEAPSDMIAASILRRGIYSDCDRYVAESTARRKAESEACEALLPVRGERDVAEAEAICAAYGKELAPPGHAYTHHAQGISRRHFHGGVSHVTPTGEAG